MVENANSIANKPEISTKFLHWSGSTPFNWSNSPGIMTVYSMFSLKRVYSVLEFVSFLPGNRPGVRFLLPCPDGSKRSKQKSGWQSDASMHALIYVRADRWKLIRKWHSPNTFALQLKNYVYLWMNPKGAAFTHRTQEECFKVQEYFIRSITITGRLQNSWISFKNLFSIQVKVLLSRPYCA